MFTVILKFRPLDEYDPQPAPRAFESRGEALQYGRSSACMAGITDVYVYDEDMAIASYNRITNYWYEFKDTNDKSIHQERFFSQLRKKTEQRAIKHGFNIRIRHQGLHWKVLASERSIPIDPAMLPWVSDAVEETEIKQYDKEEDGLEPLSDKELLEIFSNHLTKRIAERLKNNPACFSRLRWDKPFDKL